MLILDSMLVRMELNTTTTTYREARGRKTPEQSGSDHRWRISRESRWNVCQFDRALWTFSVFCHSPDYTIINRIITQLDAGHFLDRTQPDPTRVLELMSDPWPDQTRPKASMEANNHRIFFYLKWLTVIWIMCQFSTFSWQFRSKSSKTP